MIKVFVHINSLQAFQEGKWINGRFQFIGQDDIELILPLKSIEFSYQQTGFTLRKKRKWYKRLLNID